MSLSKSLYTRGLQCKKSLWLKKYKKDVLTPVDKSTQEVFKNGDEVGELACRLFPDGVKVEFDKDLNSMVDKTIQLIADGQKIIYEASFNFDGIFVAVDILVIDEDKNVKIYEVKSSTWNPKKTTKHFQKYIDDISIQYYVVKNCGFEVTQANLVVLDSTYKRGDELEIEKLFKILDFTPEVVTLQDYIPSKLQEFNSVLYDKENEPDVKIGTHCLKPYDCDAMEYCWHKQEKIHKQNIFDIFNRNEKGFEIYHSGIKTLQDIKNSDIQLTPKREKELNLLLDNKVIIDKSAIKEFLDSLSYPLYHLDFETFQQAVPEFKGVSPFMQIPFQYSIHIEKDDGSLEHREFLAKCGDDPRYKLAKRLVEDIPTDVTVLAYNMKFEKSVIKNLADSFSEFSDKLMKIHDNIKDLMKPFEDKNYYDPAMKGSYSIKVVLPTLVPEFENA